MKLSDWETSAEVRESESAASDVLRRKNIFFKSSDHEGKACNAQHPDQLILAM